VQVNGRLRAHLHVAFGTAKQELERLAREHEKVKVFTDGRQIERVVIVPDKLINLVVR
jgi:leucyl-tRNA synthetase